MKNELSKTIELTETFLKSHVKEHTRRSKSGAVSMVKEHEDNRHQTSASHPAIKSALKKDSLEEAGEYLANHPAFAGWTAKDHGLAQDHHDEMEEKYTALGEKHEENGNDEKAEKAYAKAERHHNASLAHAGADFHLQDKEKGK